MKIGFILGFLSLFFLCPDYCYSAEDTKPEQLIYVLDWSQDGSQVLIGRRIYGYEGELIEDILLFNLEKKTFSINPFFGSKQSCADSLDGFQKSLKQSGFTITLEDKLCSSERTSYFKKIEKNNLSTILSDGKIKYLPYNKYYKELKFFYFSKNSKNFLALGPSLHHLEVAFGDTIGSDVVFKSDTQIKCERGEKKRCEALVSEMVGSEGIVVNFSTIIEKFGPPCLAYTTSPLCEIVKEAFNQLFYKYTYCELTKEFSGKIGDYLKKFDAVLNGQKANIFLYERYNTAREKCKDGVSSSGCAAAYSYAKLIDDRTAAKVYDEILFKENETQCPKYNFYCERLKQAANSFTSCNPNQRIASAKILCDSLKKNHPDQNHFCEIEKKLSVYENRIKIRPTYQLDFDANVPTKIECLKAIKNKDYSALEFSICEKEVTSKDIISCLADFGRPKSKSDPCPMVDNKPPPRMFPSRNKNRPPPTADFEGDFKFSADGYEICRSVMNKTLRIQCKKEIIDSCYDPKATNICKYINKSTP